MTVPVSSLKFEIEVPPAGLVNLVRNPNGDKGAWGWVTPVASTNLSRTTIANSFYALLFSANTAATAYTYTEAYAVAAANYAAGRVDITGFSGTITVKARVEFLDANKASLSLGAASAAASTGTVYAAATLAPAGTVYARLRLEFFGAGGTGAQSAGSSLSFYKAMLTKAATNSFSSVRTNLVTNPSFETNTTGWTGDAGATLSRVTTQQQVGAASLSVAQSSSFVRTYTDAAVTAGLTYTGSIYVKPPFVSTVVELDLAWYNGGTLIGTTSSGGTANLTGWNRISATGTAPAGATTLRLSVYATGGSITTYWDAAMVEQTAALGAYFDGSSTGAGVTYAWTGTANNSTSTESITSGFAYAENVAWQDVTGTSNEITSDTAALDAGLLSATILDPALDPAASVVIRPGKRVRVSAYDGVAWNQFYEGQITLGKTSYTPRTRVTIEASNNVANLSNVVQPYGVATVNELPFILEGNGVPWNCGTANGNQVATASIVAVNENASLLDQIAITRDTDAAYAWVDDTNVLNVKMRSTMPTTPVVVFGDAASYQVARRQLIPNQSFETDTSGWFLEVVGGSTGVNIARSTAQAAAGSASLALTAASDGTTSTLSTYSDPGNPYSISGGLAYTLQGRVRAATTARPVLFNVTWYNAAGATISTLGDGTSGAGRGSDSNSTWNTYSLTVTAPSTANRATVKISFKPTTGNLGASEVHYVDALMMEQSSTAGTYFDGLAIQSYTDATVDFATDSCINSVPVTWLRYAGGETTEIQYGPYLDASSISMYGIHSPSSSFVLQGGTESPAAIATFAAGVLTANSVPKVQVHNLTFPVRNAKEVTLATSLNLYDVVRVTYSNKIVNQDLRVTGIKHTITPDPDHVGIKWLVTLQFDAVTSVAQPQQTASPINGTVTISDGTWIAPTLTGSFTNYGAGYDTVGYMRKDGIVYLKGLAGGGALNAGAFNLPPGYRPNGDGLFNVMQGNNLATRLHIRTGDGAVYFDATFTNGTYSSFAGVSFPAGA